MSQRIIFKGTTLKFETKKFAIEADKALQRLFYGAARAFLIASVRRIPARTGFLRGAFTTLEDAVGAYAYSRRGKGAIGGRPRKSRAKAARRPSKKLIALEQRQSKAGLKHAKLVRRISELRQRALKRGRPSESYQAALDRLTRFNKMRGNLPLQVARVRDGRIRGTNLQGGFRTKPGERVLSVFRLIEYYYPSKGRRVLKTPRSGRQFATPAPLIITKQASRVTTKQSTGRWVFRYKVDISYLSINDIREAWHSWADGMGAFHAHIAANFKKEFPDPTKFFLKQQIGKKVLTIGQYGN